MKKAVQFPIILMFMLLTAPVFAQAVQQNFINYQGVARDADGKPMGHEEVDINIKLRFGAPDAPVVYDENHYVTTDAAGVFSLKIGTGRETGDPYKAVVWNGFAPYTTLSLNGHEMGTTEMLAVPYAITSGDKQFIKSSGNAIMNSNTGGVGIGEDKPEAKLDVDGDLKLELGTAINNFSTDGTLSGNSDTAVPTEKAVKTYVDTKTATAGDPYWSPKGNNIRTTNTGNVGIGAPDPYGKLHIAKNFGSSPFLNLESLSGDRANIRFGKNGSTDFWDQIAGIRTEAASGTMSYYYDSNNIMTLRGDGKVGINTFDPQAALDVEGDINTTGEVHTSATGNVNMLPIAYGSINASGGIKNGSGNFTVEKVRTGIYQIRLNGEPIVTNRHTAMATGGNRDIRSINVSIRDAVYMEVQIVVGIGGGTFQTGDADFSFVIYRP